MKIILHKIILVMGLLFPYITNLQAQDYNLLSEQTHYKIALNKASCSGDDGTLAVTINEDIAENYDNYIYELKNAETGAVLSTTGTITNTAHIFTKLEPGEYTTKIKAFIKIKKIALHIFSRGDFKFMVNDEGKENVWIDWDNDGVKDENEGIKEYCKDFSSTDFSRFISEWYSIPFSPKYVIGSDVLELCPKEISEKYFENQDGSADFPIAVYGDVVGFYFNLGVADISISKNSKLEYIWYNMFAYNTNQWNLETQKSLKYLYVNGVYDLDFSKVPLAQLKTLVIEESHILTAEQLKEAPAFQKTSVGKHVYLGPYLDLSIAENLEFLSIANASKLESVNLANENNENLQKVLLGEGAYVVGLNQGCPLLKCIQLDTGFTPPNEWKKNNNAEWSTDGTACP